MDGIPSGAWRLLGIELHGASPLGAIRMPLTGDRIAALYGLNGAGKTVVLSALSSALRGTCPDSGLLSSFSIHIELRDEGSEDGIVRSIRERAAYVLRRGYGGPQLDPKEVALPAIWRALLSARLRRITEDPCCSDELRSALAIPTDAAPPRAILSHMEDGILGIALAVRPDDDGPRLLRDLCDESFDVDNPLDPGGPGALIWRSLRHHPDPPTDHRCVLHVGSANARVIERAIERGSERVLIHARAAASRWAHMWLGSTHGFRPTASAGWWSLPLLPVGRVRAEAILPIVVSEETDLETAARAAVRRVSAQQIVGEPENPATRDLEAWRRGLFGATEQEVDEFMEAYERWQEEIEDGHLYEELIGLHLDEFAEPPPEIPRFVPPSDLIHGENRTVFGPDEPDPTRISTALRIVNAGVLTWARQFLDVADRSSVKDRHGRLAALDFAVELRENDLEVDLSRLSTAQERWVRLAIAMLGAREWRAGPEPGTAHLADLPHVVMILDEPERSLHRAQERQVGRRIEGFVTRGNTSVIMATHSPLMLDSPATVLHHVRMVDDSIRVMSEPLGSTFGLDDVARGLGARRSDIASLYRLFLLVEGEVDRAVLEGLFGDELQRNRVLVLPLGGTDYVHTAVTPFKLLAFTDAPILLMLDDIDARRMSEVWRRADELLRTEGRARAAQWVGRQRFDRRPEKLAAELAERALRDGLFGRTHVTGFKAIDILELIPPALLGSSGSADDLRAAMEADAGRRWTSQRTKEWLKSTGADLSIDSVKRAVSQMDEIPEELSSVLDLVQSLAQQGSLGIAARPMDPTTDGE